MVRKEATIRTTTGLHARPATLLVRKASSFKSEIFLEFDDKKANAKSLINVLSLGVTKGSKILITASGDDETLAAEEMFKLIESLKD